MEEEIELEEIKQILLYGDYEIGYVESWWDKGSSHVLSTIDGMPEDFVKMVSKAMPKKMFDLGKKYGIGFPPDIKHELGQYDPLETVYENEFYELSECEKKGRKAIEDREKRLKAFQKKVLDSSDGKYDKVGIISIPKYKTNDKTANFGGGNYPRATIERYIQIEVTQRELAEAGILPEDFEWREKPLVTSRDIAELDKESSLKTTEVGKTKSVINRLREIFKGKGEK